MAASVLRSLAIVAGTEGAPGLRRRVAGPGHRIGPGGGRRPAAPAPARLLGRDEHLAGPTVAEKAYGDALSLAAEIGDFSARLFSSPSWAGWRSCAGTH